VAGVRGMGGTRTAYATSKAADAVLAEGIRAELLHSGLARRIRVTTVHPGFIETDINTGRRGPFTVPLDPGVDALVAAIEREPVRAYVPEWPWRAVAGLMRVVPLPLIARVSS
jgi:NAD(P)-dependent dehydrogenase (short-subunit alcohol dehydrogenase family)